MVSRWVHESEVVRNAEMVVNNSYSGYLALEWASRLGVVGSQCLDLALVEHRWALGRFVDTLRDGRDITTQLRLIRVAEALQAPGIP